MTRPTPEQYLKAAWGCESPSSIPMLDKSPPHLDSFWGRMLQRILEWEREGATSEQITGAVEEAKEQWENYWAEQRRINGPYQKRKATPEQKLLADDLLKGITF